MKLNQDLVDALEKQLDETTQFLEQKWPEREAEGLAKREVIGAVTKLLNEWA